MMEIRPVCKKLNYQKFGSYDALAFFALLGINE